MKPTISHILYFYSTVFKYKNDVQPYAEIKSTFVQNNSTSMHTWGNTLYQQDIRVFED